MTKNANTTSQHLTSQYRIFFAIVFSVFFFQNGNAQTVNPPIEPSSAKNPAPRTSTNPISQEAPRKIQLIQLPAHQLNFKFSEFKTSWLTSENDWKALWKDSRLDGEVPTLPVQWKSESVLAIFWPSKDAVVRIPSFSGTEVTVNNASKQIKFYFNLNTPCFGIITDTSPAQLLLIDQDLADIDRIVIHTDNTRTTDCF